MVGLALIVKYLSGRGEVAVEVFLLHDGDPPPPAEEQALRTSFGEFYDLAGGRG
jgi:hypothetical protein